MKWVWVLFLLLIPWLSASAALYDFNKGNKLVDVPTLPMHSDLHDGTIQSKSGQAELLKFSLLPLRDLPNIRTEIRLYFAKDLLPDEAPRGQCYIKIKDQGVFPLRDYFMFTGHGPELWLSDLTVRQLAEVLIIWQRARPELQYTQTVVETGSFKKSRGWITKGNWDGLLGVQVKDLPVHFREVLLDDVCLKPDRNQPFPFSEEELQTFQFLR